jgi:hypothetical protein
MTNLDGMLYHGAGTGDFRGPFYVSAHYEGVCELEVTDCDFQFRRQKDLARKIEALHLMDRLRSSETRRRAVWSLLQGRTLRP